MKSKKGQTIKGREYSLKNIFWIGVLLFLVFYPIYFLIRSWIRSSKLETENIPTRGVIIDERNYAGHSPVSHTFYYSYEFSVRGLNYRGNSQSSEYSVGDSVDIEYTESNPDFNRLIKPN